MVLSSKEKGRKVTGYVISKKKNYTNKFGVINWDKRGYFEETWETCVSSLWLGKYMVLESYISETWDFPINGENIIFLVHYILFRYAFPKLPFNVSLLAATCVHVIRKVCNLISTKIWNLKLSNLKLTKHSTWETFEICETFSVTSSRFALTQSKKIPIFITRLIHEGNRFVYLCPNQAMDTHLPKVVFVSFWPNPSVSLFTSWPPKPNRHLLKTFNEAKVEAYLYIS